MLGGTVLLPVLRSTSVSAMLLVAWEEGSVVFVRVGAAVVLEGKAAVLFGGCIGNSVVALSGAWTVSEVLFIMGAVVMGTWVICAVL